MSAPRIRVLVLGASGFIGRRIVAALAASGWADPIAAGHRHVAPVPAGVASIRLDALDAAALRAAMSGVDAVVNSIAGDGATIVDNARILFAVAGEQARPPRVIHLSTMSVYGSATGLVDERAPLRGDLGEYSSAKVEAERQAATHPNTVVLRPGIVYGPESPLWSELIGRLLLQRRLGDLGAAGDGICNLVHVDDVAAAVVAALRLAGIEGRAFNLSLPQAPTWNMYFARYAQALGAVPVRRIGSMRLGAELKLAGPLLKIGEALRIADGLRLPPPIRPWLIDQCRHAIQLDVQKAQDVLGMHWRTLDDGLRETAAWLQGRMQR